MVDITALADPGPEAGIPLGRVCALPRVIENVSRAEIIEAVFLHAGGLCGDVSDEERMHGAAPSVEGSVITAT
jgi:hypothetical protein